MISHARLAQYAARSYIDDVVIDIGHGLEYAHWVDVSGAYQVLSVQGSDVDPRDWIRNGLNMFPRWDRELGRGVWGYHRASRRLVDHLVETDRIDSRIPLLIVGHSAGAGIGAYAAIRLVKRGYVVDTFLGMATPRIGTHSLPGMAWLYDHAGDPVCNLPPWWGTPRGVRIVMLSDQSAGPLQHSLEYYLAGIAERDINGA